MPCRSFSQSLQVSSSLGRNRSNMLDCLVIGGGPAGLLAPVYLARYRQSVQVIDAGESRAAKIPESHNYPGFFGIAGPELLRRLNAQARQYGAEMVRGRVLRFAKKAKPLSRRLLALTSMLGSYCLQQDSSIIVPQLKASQRTALPTPSDSAPSAMATKPSIAE